MAMRMSAYEQQFIREIHSIPREYWPNLLKLVHVFRESVTLKTAEDSFRQGWQDSLAGQTSPVSDLWDGIDAA
jgi:hypothetical protein